MTEEEYTKVKELYIENVKEIMLDQGGLFPHLTIFADHKVSEGDEPRTAIIHVPIPEEYMVDDENKDEFVNEVMPDIYKTVKKKFIPYGIGWASEAWMRVADKDFDINVFNYKDLPIKKEVLLVSIEMDDNSNTFIYEIKRNGSQVNSEGKLTDKIDLLELEDMSSLKSSGGRFSGLYKKLNK
jgi:hypothetical protein